MIRTIIAFIYAVLATILAAPGVLFYKLTYTKDPLAPPCKYPQWAVNTLFPPFAKICGVKFDVRGKENLPNEPALYTGNHQGNFDFLVLALCIGELRSTVAKIELTKLPVLKQLMDLFQCIYIDRQDMRQSLSCMKIAQSRIEKGLSVNIFPEGTRSRKAEMGEFKHGAFRIATKTNCLVVPFAIDGSYKIMESQKWITPGTIKVSILPPVHPEELNMKSNELSEYVKGLIQAELDKMRAE